MWTGGAGGALDVCTQDLCIWSLPARFPIPHRHVAEEVAEAYRSHQGGIRS